jgi:hypothetical protein
LSFMKESSWGRPQSNLMSFMVRLMIWIWHIWCLSMKHNDIDTAFVTKWNKYWEFQQYSCDYWGFSTFWQWILTQRFQLWLKLPMTSRYYAILKIVIGNCHQKSISKLLFSLTIVKLLYSLPCA